MIKSVSLLPGHKLDYSLAVRCGLVTEFDLTECKWKEVKSPLPGLVHTNFHRNLHALSHSWLNVHSEAEFHKWEGVKLEDKGNLNLSHLLHGSVHLGFYMGET